MKDIRNRANDIIEKYEAELASSGMRIEASKRYFEVNVTERSDVRTDSGNLINILFNYIAKASDNRREKKKGYNYQKNQYHCLVLTLIPEEDGLLKREFCKDYAFVLRKVERAHIGEKPQKVAYEENKALSKIEKRIVKIIKKAEKTNAQKLCKDTFWDALRYIGSNKYEYKRKFCGKDRLFWYIVALVLSVGSVFALILIVWLISKL